MTYERHKKAAQLARWLGPWATTKRLPSGVVRTPEQLDGVRAYHFEPQDGAVSGTYVVVQGLHYEGPDDPRLDRLCRVLAAAGFTVIAPFISDYLELRVTPKAATDLAVACEHAVQLSAQRGLPRPALFSWSFGSVPAIDVASSNRFRDAIGALLLFGGYFDFNATIRFAVTARAYDGGVPIDLPHDPLNAPAVFVNLLDHLEPPGPIEQLRHAWLEMARRTWGRPELRTPRKRIPIAEALAAELPAEQRELFLIGCGLRPGAAALLEEGLARAGDHFSFADPTARLQRIGVPVVVGHGRYDDMVPYTEAAKLGAALPGDHHHRVLVTGLYGHTRSTIGGPAKLASEARNMLDMLYTLVDAPHEAL